MRELMEVGTCPKCGLSIMAYKTNSYKRFAKCEECGTSYPLPKRGSLEYSALVCPETQYPILIVNRKNQEAYFWADRPCFTCTKYDKCQPIKELIAEFKELEVYGY